MGIQILGLSRFGAWENINLRYPAGKNTLDLCKELDLEEIREMRTRGLEGLSWSSMWDFRNIHWGGYFFRQVAQNSVQALFLGSPYD